MLSGSPSTIAGGTRTVWESPCSWPRMCRLRTLLPAVAACTLICGALLINRQPTITKPPWLDLKTCSPRSNIAYLKTHKCASSAMQNILFRYGDNHNLHFALPDKGNYFGGGGKIFKADMVLSSPLNKLTPNIFAIHTKWDHAEVKKVMPEDTVFFTVVREPTALFQSLFAYGKFEERTGLTLEEYVRKVPSDSAREVHNTYGYNQMAWDFGMPQEQLNILNITATREMVRRADEQFGLVLVTERMEESLVLLAKFLCWKLSDVLVLRLNSLRDNFKTTISEETRQVLQQKLAPDYLLYNYFLMRFDQHVEDFGRDRMAAAVARLRELMELLVDTCNFVQREIKELNGTKKSWSDGVIGFKTEACDGCRPFTMGGLSYLNKVREKQRRELLEKFGTSTENDKKEAHTSKDEETNNKTKNTIKIKEKDDDGEMKGRPRETEDGK